MGVGRVLGGILIGGITVGLSYSLFQVGKLIQIDYKFAGWKLVSINDNKDVQISNLVQLMALRYVHADFYMNIINPSNFDVHLLGYDLDVNIKCADWDKYITVSHLSSSKPFTLTAKDITILTLSARIDLNNVKDATLNKEIIANFASKNYDKILINIHGTVNGKVLIPIKNKKIDITMSLKDIQDAIQQPYSQTT